MLVRDPNFFQEAKSKSRILEDCTLQGVPAECIFGRGKGAAVRQISGEVYAAAQASTCCDVTGEESPNGAPREMHALCGVPGLEGEF